MLYNLESERAVHSTTLKDALKNTQSEDPDMYFITENGHKVYSHKILLIMYSKTLGSILEEYKANDIPGVSLPVASPSGLLNLFKILTEGVVFSTDSDELLEVGKVARVLGVSLQGIQLGRRKVVPGKQMKDSTKLKAAPNNVLTENIGEHLMMLSKTAVTMDPSDTRINRSIKSEAVECEEQEVETDGNEDGTNNLAKGKRNCDECGKVFSSRQVLETHNMMIHSIFKPFKCDVCEKSFRTGFAMKQHMLTHSDSKPFSCHCGQMFTLKSSLKRHAIKFHNVDSDA